MGKRCIVPLVMTLCVLTLAGCAPPTPTGTPQAGERVSMGTLAVTLAPTSMSEPTPVCVDGQSDLPVGKYVFAEYHVDVAHTYSSDDMLPKGSPESAPGGGGSYPNPHQVATPRVGILPPRSIRIVSSDRLPLSPIVHPDSS